ncbi:MAG: hydroxyacid dehydrogenase [Chloroflexota bacterium]|nr:hydroxyacid dehydrogenase [Chloroflexota bacterium]MDE2932057.1 hydroxyacid dehydrogenase [Chloroflexota bacterium]
MPKPEVFVAITQTLRKSLFSPESEERLAELFTVRGGDHDDRLSSADLAGQVGGCTALLTGWGTPQITPDVLSAASDLRIIAHSAGSVRRLIPIAALEKGIAVTHAAALIAEAVAEFTVFGMLLGLRWPHRQNAWIHAGKPWSECRATGGNLLEAQRVGLIGCGYVAQRVIRKLQGFGMPIAVYDPYLLDEHAAEFNVTRVSLEELFSTCRVIANHAPTTPETDGMVTAAHFKLLQDGGVFINNARARAVNQDDMIAELATGRIRAVLDVFNPEPLTEDSPLRGMENVFLTPHMAGQSDDTRMRQGAAMVAELERFLNDEPLQYPITLESYDRMA